MNGIVHNCVHGSLGSQPDKNRYSKVASIPRLPRDIFLDVFKYVDNIVTRIAPRAVLYLAVDGVAPRAKMNQQRARRFRSAKDRVDEHEKRMREDPLYAASEVEPFDSNCITPGTSFMYGLTEALRYFVARKISEDRAWTNLQVVLSGPEALGEGEHKIMEYIRAERESGSMAPNLRHCVYGLDADLIMLALCTHEPHFFLLREKIDFTAWKKKNGPRVATSLDMLTFGEFQLLSIGVLREYIMLELGADGNLLLPFFNLERLLDDFVFILVLIGNDFLPNLPTLSIADGTLSVLLHLYKRLLPFLGGYITDAGTICAHRFEFFMAKLASIEEDVMNYKRAQVGGNSRGRHRGPARALALSSKNLDKFFGIFPPEEGQPPAQPLNESEMARETLSCRATLAKNSSLCTLKADYYREKLGPDFVAESGGQSQRKLVDSYIDGLSWVLKYYTEGCRQWRWFFPFHYAPLASDIVDVDRVLRICQHEIVPDRPFLPWEQLLSVIPPLSAACLPAAIRSLMTSASSPIRDNYPDDFETDLNGKRNDWEAVVLLPFVDEDLLMEAVRSIPSSAITAEEAERNTLGPPILYVFSETYNQVVKSPFPNRLTSFVSRAKPTTLVLPVLKEGQPFSPILREGTICPPLSDELSDMPTLMLYDFAAQLQKSSVNIFGMPSKNNSLVLHMRFPKTEFRETFGNPSPTAGPVEGVIDISNDQAFGLSVLDRRGISVGSSVWMGFPWRKPAFVESIVDSMVTRTAKAADREAVCGATVRSDARATPASEFEHLASVVVANLMQKNAVAVETPTQVVGVRVEDEIYLFGDREKESISTCLDQFLKPRVIHLSVPPHGETPTTSLSPTNDMLTKGKTVLYIGYGPYFGHLCSVVSPSASGSNLKVRFNRAIGAAREPPFGYRVVSLCNNGRWLTLSRLASDVGVSPGVVDAFLGSLRVRMRSEKEEVDLGLGIKYIGRELYIPGFARRDDRHHFLFSEKSADLLRKYKDQFPDLFSNVERVKRDELRSGGGRSKGGVIYNANDILPSAKKVDDALRAITGWLSVQEVASLPLVSSRADVLSKDVVGELEKHCSIIQALQADYESSLSAADATKGVKDVAPYMVVNGQEGVDWDWSEAGENGASLYYEPVAPNAFGLRLGDRVVNRIAQGSVPFGLRGTVVGIHPSSDGEGRVLKGVDGEAEGSGVGIVEVVFDEGFIGGGSLGGRCSEGRGKAVLAQCLFIVRPERENGYYMKQYARVAAQVAAASGRNSSDEEGVGEGRVRSTGVADAAVVRFREASDGKGASDGRIDVDRDDGGGGSGKTEVKVGAKKDVGGGSEGVEKHADVDMGAGQLPLPSFVLRRRGKADGGEASGSEGGARGGNGLVGKKKKSAGKKGGDGNGKETEAATLARLLKKELGLGDSRAGDSHVDMTVDRMFVSKEEDVGKVDRGVAEEEDQYVQLWNSLQRQAGKK